MTLLEDLWYGNIDPQETFLDQNRYYKKLLSLLGKNRDELNGTLTDKQKEMLEKYEDTANEMHSFSERFAFRYGFSLGVKLMMECVTVQLTTEDE